MPRRQTAIPVIAGAPSAEQIASALSLLAFLSDPKSQKAGKANLEALEAATKANAKALADLQGRLVEVDDEAVADREAAAQELTDAKAEAVRLIEAGRVEADKRVNVLNIRDRDISDREAALKTAQEVQDKREADYKNETAKLRAAL